MHSLKDVFTVLRYSLQKCGLRCFFGLVFFSYCRRHKRINIPDNRNICQTVVFPVWAASCGTKMKRCWARRPRRLQDPKLLNQLLLLLTSNPLLWKSRRSPIGTLTHTRVCLLWTFLLRSTCQIFSFEYHCSSERFIVSFLQYWLFHTPWIKFIYILNKVEIKASCPIFFPPPHYYTEILKCCFLRFRVANRPLKYRSVPDLTMKWCVPF